MKRINLVSILVAFLLFAISATAQTVFPTPISDAISNSNEAIGEVATYGASAMVIAAGLALGFTIIAFIKKAKR